MPAFNPQKKERTRAALQSVHPRDCLPVHLEKDTQACQTAEYYRGTGIAGFLYK